MDSDALVKIQDVVDRYCLKRKVPLDDWVLFLEHAGDCAREMAIHHTNVYKTSKVHSVSSGIFGMPKDMISLINLSVPYNGRLWTLSEDGALDITTIEGYPTNKVDEGLVYYENFLDRESFINRGGSVSGDLAFGAASTSFDGTDDYMAVPINLDGTYTIVIKANLDDVASTQYLLDFGANGGTGSVSLAISAFSPSSGTSYVDGTATTAVAPAGGAVYYVVSGISITSDMMYIGSTYGGASFYDGSIDYIAIYDYPWTAAEVTSGYSDDSDISATTADTLLDYKTTDYGARGGNNLYYYQPDWKRRKIYINGIPTETVILQYISSGISSTGDTYIPAQASQVVDAYLRWMQADIEGGGINERRDRERLYKDALMMLRKTNLPSAAVFKDILLSMITQVPIR